MDAHMNGHVVRLIECFATQFTLIWLKNKNWIENWMIFELIEADNEQLIYLFTRMRSHMCC